MPGRPATPGNFVRAGPHHVERGEEDVIDLTVPGTAFRAAVIRRPPEAHAQEAGDRGRGLRRRRAPGPGLRDPARPERAAQLGQKGSRQGGEDGSGAGSGRAAPVAGKRADELGLKPAGHPGSDGESQPRGGLQQAAGYEHAGRPRLAWPSIPASPAVGLTIGGQVREKDLRLPSNWGQSWRADQGYMLLVSSSRGHPDFGGQDDQRHQRHG